MHASGPGPGGVISCRSVVMIRSAVVYGTLRVRPWVRTLELIRVASWAHIDHSRDVKSIITCVCFFSPLLLALCVKSGDIACIARRIDALVHVRELPQLDDLLLRRLVGDVRVGNGCY